MFAFPFGVQPRLLHQDGDDLGVLHQQLSSRPKVGGSGGNSSATCYRGSYGASQARNAAETASKPDQLAAAAQECQCLVVS